MSSNPSVLTSLMPGANISGTSVAVPTTPTSTTPSIGGTANPFLTPTSTGQSATPMTAPTAPATFSPSGATGGLGGSNTYNLLGGGQNKAGIIKGLEKTGVPGGIAALLAEFLMSGAGFNPQVANALINALQPQFQRGEESLVEQFSATGNRFSSDAAIGLGDYAAQTNLEVGQIFAQMYEQSVQDYLGVLMGAGKSKPTFGDAFKLSFGQGLGSGAASLITG